MTLPDESKDIIGKSQEIWNWLVHPLQNRMATDNVEGGVCPRCNRVKVHFSLYTLKTLNSRILLVTKEKELILVAKKHLNKIIANLG